MTQDNAYVEIKNSKDPQKAIDNLFRDGRQYFTDDEYSKLPAMFRLLFILKAKKTFNKQL